MFPGWLHLLSLVALALGAACALVILFDVLRHPQKMAVMNVVWPVNGLRVVVPVRLPTESYTPRTATTW